MSSMWRWRIACGVAALLTMLSPAAAQPAGTAAPLIPRFTDPVHGLSLDEAVAQALAREPSLRAVRAEIDVARGLRLQAGLRPNPSVSFEQREEPGGTDRQAMVGVEWPLDLFRRRGRTDVAERDVALAEHAAADRERLVAAGVRARYGDLLVAIRELAILDELVAAIARQRDLLRSRVDEGASPPLERDLLEVEVRRLESGRLLEVGRAEAALFELKRAMGLPIDESVTVAGTLEAIVQAEAVRELSAGVDAAQGRADVRAAEARITVAEARLDRARREGRFDVRVFGSYMRMDAGFPQRAFGREGGLERVRGLFHYVSAGAIVTLPLLNRQQGEVAAARAARESAAAAYDVARLAAETEVATARALDRHAHQSVGAYAAGVVTLARQNLAVVGETYTLGRASVFDVLAEQRRFLEVEQGYTDALRAAYEARTALILALGETP